MACPAAVGDTARCPGTPNDQQFTEPETQLTSQFNLTRGPFWDVAAPSDDRETRQTIGSIPTAFSGKRDESRKLMHKNHIWDMGDISEPVFLSPSSPSQTTLSISWSLLS